MKLAPPRWSGQAQQLIQEVLKPLFPKKERVQIWQDLLLRRLEEADPVFMLGFGASELKSRWGQVQTHLTQANSRVVFGDRATTTAILTYLIESPEFSTEKASALLLHLPHHSFDLEKFTKWASFTNNASSAGWLTAHLFKPWDADESWESLSAAELKKRSLRHLHPLNAFLFPNLNKSGAAFAEDPRFLALLGHHYAEHYGELWSQFLSLTGDSLESLPARADFAIDLASKVELPVATKTEARDPISKIDPKEAFDLKLVTVNEAQGSHSRVIEPAQMTRGLLDIKLEYKEKGGEIQTVGFFRLNLKELFEKKFIAHDAKGLKLAIYKTDQGFQIAPRKNAASIHFPS